MVPKRPWPSPARMLGLSYKEHVEDNSENYAFTCFQFYDDVKIIDTYINIKVLARQLQCWNQCFVFLVTTNDTFWLNNCLILFDKLTLNGNPTLVKKTVLILISIRCKLVDLCPKKFDEFIFISMAQIIWSRGRPVELLSDVH